MTISLWMLISVPTAESTKISPIYKEAVSEARQGNLIPAEQQMRTAHAHESENVVRMRAANVIWA